MNMSNRDMNMSISGKMSKRGRDKGMSEENMRLCFSVPYVTKFSDSMICERNMK
jgi:hypothetical protein